MKKITDDIFYTGVEDTTLDLFEGQYPVPNGVSYNSYVINNDKGAVIFDTADARASEQWLNNIKEVLGDKKPDYLIVSHMEPDHSANIEKIAGIYPDMKIIGNKRTFPMLANFTSLDLDGRTVTVGEGSTLDLCGHELKFILAPMVHWPEVMMTYDATSKILFSADAFGRFGSTDEKDDADFSEARRYYFNIVGKYGAQVSAVLEKAKTLDIRKICSLHGPVIEKRLAAYLEKYSIWSAYKAECPENITVAYASIHGNTRQAAQFLAEEIGGKAELYDLGRCDLSEAVSAAFKNGKIILLCSTYDGGIFTPMKNYISRLQSKTFRMRKVAFVENGSWAPQAGKLMRAEFECMPAMTFCEKTVTVMSSVKETTKTQLSALAETVLKM